MGLFSEDDYLDLTPAELERRATAKENALIERRLTPDWWQQQGDLCLPAQGLSVAIIGAGYAGLAAGWYLKQCGVNVTVYEAKGQIGGRVRTDRHFIPGRAVEAGAELIGRNHALFRILARRYGLTLDPLGSPPCNPPGLSRTRFGNHDLTHAEEQDVKRRVRPALVTIGQEADPISQDTPWLSPNAASYDRTSVAQVLDRLLGHGTGNPRRWLELVLGNDNCATIEHQSYLGLLSSVSACRLGQGSGLLSYWLSTETHRCRNGNDLLGERLAQYLHPDLQTSRAVTSITITTTPSGWPPMVITHNVLDAQGQPIHPNSEAFDYAILTAPPPVWAQITIAPTFTPASRSLQHGPAVKFLTRYRSRFWCGEHPPLEPDALWDLLGTVWESTDSPPTPASGPPTPGFGLSVFSGGQYVQSARDYTSKLTTLYPSRQRNLLGADQLVDWTTEPFIHTGYAVPGLGQASTIHPNQQQPHATRLFFAGEQTSPGFFGYMEGALQSGTRAARDIIISAAVPCPQRRYPRTADARDGGGLPGGTKSSPEEDSGFTGGGGESGGGGASGEF